MPALRLYLSNNSLDDVPGEVYKLENLKVLSLRSNNITEVLPSISKLINLDEANFGCNQLKWLPWEFLEFFRKSFGKCTLHPNPFLIMNPSMESVERYRDGGEYPSQHLASTHTAFLDITGASYREYPPAPTSISENWAEPLSYGMALRPPLEECQRIPSLLELAVRACYKAPQLSQLPFLLPNDCPPHLRQLLESTWKLKEAGGKTCSVCEQEYVIPRTEWIEWWCGYPHGAEEPKNPIIHSHGFTPIPFLRRGCSWQCYVKTPPYVLIRGWSSAVEP